jgi:hypothetical protein
LWLYFCSSFMNYYDILFPLWVILIYLCLWFYDWFYFLQIVLQSTVLNYSSPTCRFEWSKIVGRYTSGEIREWGGRDVKRHERRWNQHFWLSESILIFDCFMYVSFVHINLYITYYMFIYIYILNFFWILRLF